MLAARDFATKASKNERGPGTLWSCPIKFLEKYKNLQLFVMWWVLTNKNSKDLINTACCVHLDAMMVGARERYSLLRGLITMYTDRGRRT